MSLVQNMVRVAQGQGVLPAGTFLCRTGVDYYKCSPDLATAFTITEVDTTNSYVNTNVRKVKER